MKVKDFNNFQQPNRRPWLLLIVLAVAALLLAVQRFRSGPRPEIKKSTVERSRKIKTYTAKPTARMSNELRVLLDRCDIAQKEGKPLVARENLLKILKVDSLPEDLRKKVEQRLGNLNTVLVISHRTMPEKVDYIVKSRDRVEKIAREHGTTVELMKVSNGIKNVNLIKSGSWFKVFTGKFEIVVSKSLNELLVTMNGDFFKRYSVGTGIEGCTPVGTFKVGEKQVEPTWWPKDGKEVPYGDPRNILGTRWMTLVPTGDTMRVKGYGIHGTSDESTIGKPLSAGCVRMRNAEVEELYTLVPMDTPVTIIE